MAIMITGGAGFLGQRLARALLGNKEALQFAETGCTEPSAGAVHRILLVDVIEPAEAIPGAIHVRATLLLMFRRLKLLDCSVYT